MTKAKLQEDQIKAQKAQDSARLETIRYVLSRLKNQEIEKKAELEDKEVTDILRKVRREMVESVEAYEKGGRTDLKDATQKQIEIVNEYMPRELSDEELTAAVTKLVETNQEATKANPKAIIGIAIKALSSQADSSRIVAIINKMQS